MRRSPLLIGLLGATLVWGCTSELPPAGQVLLYLDTDAPLPAGPGVVLSPGAPQPLFDTVRIDVYEPGAAEPCAGCSRTFALTAPQVQAGEASIGVPSEAGRSGYRARLRMYHSASTLNGALPEPLAADWPPQSVVDLIVALPEVAEEGIVEATAFLATDDVGIPRGALDAPEPTRSGRPSTSQVGTWPGAQRVPCAGTPLEGEVCIPGGAFWMGNPLVRGTGRGDEADLRRLVVLS
ncbi:MAG: hypothetical protein JRI68_28645, partial [Deltaproteobacteria bacterium]|nr:hypothetical protein [Deltaproteobacteria bacterium]